MKGIRLKPKNCIVSLMNTARNRERLDTAVHKEFFDMSIVYHQFLPEFVPLPGERYSTALVSVDMFQKSGVTLEKLHDTALKVMKQEFPAELKPDNGIFYVATNYLKQFGSAAMLDMEFMEETAERLGESFYIVPCLRDIIQIAAESSIEAEKLYELFTDWNVRLKEYEVLSDHIYLYNRKKKQIEIVNAQPTG